MDGDRPALSGRRRVALAAVPLAFLALFFVWPLAAILERGLVDDGRLDLPLDVLARRSTLEIVWFTTWQAAASTALALLAGLPLAWAVARFSFPGRRAVEALVLVPFVLPTVVVASAFVAVLPEALQRSVWAILLAHVFFNTAVVVRLVGAYWSALDARAWDAAATLGAGPARRFRSLTLPALAPSLAAAASIVFLFCFTSFGVVLILGGPGYATLETEIYSQAARAFDLRTAAALALLQLAAVATVVTVAGRLERRTGGLRRARGEPARRPTGRERTWVALAVGGTLGLLALPLAALVRRSLSVGDGYGLDHYRRLAEQTPALLVPPWHAVLNSLLFASVAAAVALAVGVPAAVLAVRSAGGPLDTLVMLPLGASAVMLGFGFVLAFAEPPLALRGSLWLVPAAQALVATPFVVRALSPALRSVDPRLREAAAVLGATPSRVRREIDVPLVARALAVAAGLAFAIALGEFGATVLVARADHPTLPVAVFRFLGRPGESNVGQAMALCVILMVLTAAGALLADSALARRGGRE